MSQSQSTSGSAADPLDLPDDYFSADYLMNRRVDKIRANEGVRQRQLVGLEPKQIVLKMVISLEINHEASPDSDLIGLCNKRIQQLREVGK